VKRTLGRETERQYTTTRLEYEQKQKEQTIPSPSELKRKETKEFIYENVKGVVESAAIMSEEEFEEQVAKPQKEEFEEQLEEQKKMILKRDTVHFIHEQWDVEQKEKFEEYMQTQVYPRRFPSSGRQWIKKPYVPRLSDVFYQQAAKQRRAQQKLPPLARSDPRMQMLTGAGPAGTWEFYGGVIESGESLVELVFPAPAPPPPRPFTFQRIAGIAAGSYATGKVISWVWEPTGISLTGLAKKGVAKAVGFAEKTVAPEHYYYYKYVLQKPMLTTMTKEYVKGTVKAVIGEEAYMFGKYIAPPLLRQKGTQLYTYLTSTAKTHFFESPLAEPYFYTRYILPAQIEKTAPKIIPGIFPSVPTELKAFTKVTAGKIRYTFKIGTPTQTYFPGSPWDLTPEQVFPEVVGKTAQKSITKTVTIQKSVEKVVGKTARVSAMPSFAPVTIMQQWTGRPYPGTRKRVRVEEEVEWIPIGTSLVKPQRLQKAIGLQKFKSLERTGISPKISPLQKTDLLQKTETLQKTQTFQKTVAKTVGFHFTPPPKPKLPPKLGRKKKRKRKTAVPMFGWVRLEWPVAGPEKVLETVIGGKRK